jgi:hypothetical protein
MPLSEAENILWDLATSDDINYTEYFRELAEERDFILEKALWKK